MGVYIGVIYFKLYLGSKGMKALVTKENQMSKKLAYDLVVFIGRFQPLHWGHVEVIHTAFQKSKAVLVLMGSSFKCRTEVNPFFYSERKRVLVQFFQEEYIKQHSKTLFIKPLRDWFFHEDLWRQSVEQHVERILTCLLGSSSRAKVALIGHHKDQSSYYLKTFPQWDYLEVPNYRELSSTHIRQLLWNKELPIYTKELMPKISWDFIGQFRQTRDFRCLLKQQEQTSVAEMTVELRRESWEILVLLHTYESVLVERYRQNCGCSFFRLPGYNTLKSDPQRTLQEDLTKYLSDLCSRVDFLELENSIQHVTVLKDHRLFEQHRLFACIDLFLPEEFSLSSEWVSLAWYNLQKLNPLTFFDLHYDLLQSLHRSL